MKIQNQVPQNIDRAIEEYEKCNYQLNTLFDFSKDIFGILDTKGILRNSLLFTMGNFGVLDAFVGLFDLTSGEMIQFVAEGHQDADLEELQKKVRQTLMQNDLLDPGAIDVSCGDLELLPGSVVFDIAQPKDVIYRPGGRQDVLAVDAGIIHLPPATTDRYRYSGLMTNEIPSCLGETMTLTLEERWENFSLGRELYVDKTMEIGRLAEANGFIFDNFRTFTKPIPEENFEATKRELLKAEHN